MFLYVAGFAVLTIIIGLIGWLPTSLRWICLIGLWVAFVALAGKRTTAVNKNGEWHRGRWDGIFIDNRRKISLSRLQIICWTILSLSAFAVIALDRTIPVISGTISSLIPIEGSETENSSTDANNYDPLNIRFPEELIVALGISATSLAGASIIKSNKAEAKNGKAVQLLSEQKTLANTRVTNAAKNVKKHNDALSAFADELTKLRTLPEGELVSNETKLKIDQIENESIPNTAEELKIAQQELDNAKEELEKISKAEDSSVGEVHKNTDISQADWSDIFRGELVSNYQLVDVGKVQMFFFTIIIIFTYGALVWGVLGDSEGLRMNAVDLPSFSATLTGLLGLSHAGYLIVKQTGQSA